MKMTVHELHPSLVHAPLALLPAAAVLDLAAVMKDDQSLARVGRGFWVAGCVGAALAGLTGLASTQEVRAQEKEARDAMILHGTGNAIILVAASALMSWRLRNDPTYGSALLGFGACLAAVYTAYLGGEMVYTHGIGVKAMPAQYPQGSSDRTLITDGRAAGKLLQDTWKGTAWMARQLGDILRGRQTIDPNALK